MSSANLRYITHGEYFAKTLNHFSDAQRLVPRLAIQINLLGIALTQKNFKDAKIRKTNLGRERSTVVENGK